MSARGKMCFSNKPEKVKNFRNEVKFEASADRCIWLKKEEDEFFHFCRAVSVWDLLTCCPPPRIQRLSINNLQKVADFSECLELFSKLSLCPHLIREHCEVHLCLGEPLTLAAVGVDIVALHLLCSSLGDDLRPGSLPRPSSTYFQPLMLGLATASGVASPALPIAAW